MNPKQTIEIPLEDRVQEIAFIAGERAARIVIAEHEEKCAFKTQNMPERLRALEMRAGQVMGYMLGAAAAGGITGSLAARFLLTLIER